MLNKGGCSQRVAEQGSTGGGMLTRLFDIIMMSNMDGVGKHCRGSGDELGKHSQCHLTPYGIK